MRMRGNIAWIIVALLVVFGGALAYNFFERPDTKEFIRETQSRIEAAEKTLADLKVEQAELAKAIVSIDHLLRSKQQEYAARAIGEPDDKWRSVWGIYRMGFETNRVEVLGIGRSLELLRDIAGRLEDPGVKSLKAVQGVATTVAGGISDRSRKTQLLDATFTQQANLDAALGGTIQILATLVNEISSQGLSLKEQQRQVQAKVPAGSSRAVPMTDEIFKGLESWLKHNQDAQELHSKLEQAVGGVGKALDTIRDISKAQSEFLKSMQ